MAGPMAAPGGNSDSSSPDHERQLDVVAVPWLPLVAIGVLAGVAATLISLWLYPHTSLVVDERVYVQQSIAIEHGRLTMPADLLPFHKIFFTYPNADGESVFKYQPLYPAILAGFRLATGSDRTSIGVIAALAVIAVGGFAHELFRRRRVTLLAASFLGLSPMFLVVASARLSYGLSLALVAAASWAAMASLRCGRTSLLVGAGGLSGLAFFHRPYDALIFIGPVALWSLLQRRSTAGLARRAGCVACGAALPLAAMLVVNRVTTGDAFTLSYSFVGPLDQLGFGPRLDVHDGVPFDYTIGKALLTLRSGGDALWRWTIAGPLGLMALVWASWSARRRGGGLLLLLAVSSPLAYTIVWGTWNGYIRLPAITVLGPMYWLTITIPVAVSVGLFVDWLWKAQRPAVAPLLSIGLALTLLLMWPAVQRILDVQPAIQHQADRVSSLKEQAMTTHRQVVIVTDTDKLLYEDLFFNDPDLQNPVVGAIDQPGQMIELFNDFPTADFIALRKEFFFAGRPGSPTELDYLGFQRSVRSEPIMLAKAGSISLRAQFKDIAPGSIIYSRSAADVTGWTAPDGSDQTVEFKLSSRTLRLEGLTEELPAGVDPTSPGLACIGIVTPSGSTDPKRDEVCFNVGEHVENGAIEQVVVAPGRPSTLFAFDNEQMLPADVSDRLRIEVVHNGS